MGITASCGAGGRIGYRYALPNAGGESGIYGGPTVWGGFPRASTFSTAVTGGYMFATGPDMGYVGAEGMFGRWPGALSNSPYESAGTVSVLLSLGFTGDAVTVSPGLCGGYITEMNPHNLKGYYWITASGCLRWFVGQWIAVDVGPTVLVPPIYAG